MKITFLIITLILSTYCFAEEANVGYQYLHIPIAMDDMAIRSHKFPINGNNIVIRDLISDGVDIRPVKIGVFREHAVNPLLNSGVMPEIIINRRVEEKNTQWSIRGSNENNGIITMEESEYVFPPPRSSLTLSYRIIAMKGGTDKAPIYETLPTVYTTTIGFGD